MSTVTVVVNGIPAPQGSKTAYPVHTKAGKVRAVVVDGSSKSGRERHASWRDAVATACADKGVTFDEPVSVTLRLYFPLPKSDPYRTAHAVTPDADKAARSCFDGMVAGGLLRDDSLVFSFSLSKWYCHGEQTPGAIIVVEPWGAHEAKAREALKAQAKAARR